MDFNEKNDYNEEIEQIRDREYPMLKGMKRR